MFSYLLFLLCLILVLFSNLLFVLVASTTTMSTIACFKGNDNYDIRAVGRRILPVQSGCGNRGRGNSGQGHDRDVQDRGQGTAAAVKEVQVPAPLKGVCAPGGG